MNTITKPIILLADSQLLFWRDNSGLFLNRVSQILSEEGTEKGLQAAYVGAANGDEPAFYNIFVEAMNNIEINQCRMISSTPTTADYTFLDQANIILLAGGDVKKGWKIFQTKGLNTKFIERYYGGAVLIGVSAGSVHLGQKGSVDDNFKVKDIFNTLQLVPFIIDAHDEPEWPRLTRLLLAAGQPARGLGIPSGGGLIFHPDWSIEPVRQTIIEFNYNNNELKQTILLPPSPTTETNKDTL